jgi:HrpA-like RNA helicase
MTKTPNAPNAAVSDPLQAFADVGDPNWFVPDQAYSQERVEWAKKWRELPVYARKDELATLIRSYTKNEVTILVAGTGSGKTVLAPPILLRTLSLSGIQQQQPRIVITMPKQAVVRSAATTSAKTLDAALGNAVGFKYRGSPDGSTSGNVRALYATDGTLLAMARHDPSLSRFDAVMMDEAHERPVPTDLLLQAVRSAILLRRGTDRPLHLVVMSATIDPAPFLDYFSKAGLAVGLVEFPAKPNHPVERTFLKAPSKDPVSDAIDTAVHILNDPTSTGKVIVFVPTTRDAVGGCPAFEVSCSRSKKSACELASCAPLYGRQNKDEQLTALLNASNAASASRKVYVATNIAESSLTISGVDHVVDTGLQVSSIWRPLWHGTELVIHLASRAQLEQRMGRTGRTAPGQAHLMYTSAQFKALPAFPEPVILQVDVTEPLLNLLRYSPPDDQGQGQGLQAAIAVLSDLLTPPSPDQIRCAVGYLSFYGLVNMQPTPAAVPFANLPISSYVGYLTPLGRSVAFLASELKISIDNAIIVALAENNPKILPDAIDLVAILEVSKGGVEQLWRSKDGRSSPRPDKAIQRFVRNLGPPYNRSDHLALVAILGRIARVPGHALASKFLAQKPWKAIADLARSLRASRVIARRLLEHKESNNNKTTLKDIVIQARGFHRCQQRLKDSFGALPAPIAALQPPQQNRKHTVSRALFPWFVQAPSAKATVDLVYETYAKSLSTTGRALVITLL